jgi:ABC-type polysaccharide/polyol phosphate export permease
VNTPTPDTVPYLLLGLGIVTLIAAGFLGSLYVRYRNLQKDLQVIEQLRDDK